ncbi:alpha-hydroxy-acid oxidizing protein [Bradyrhizobium sp. 23AC]
MNFTDVAHWMAVILPQEGQIRRTAGGAAGAARALAIFRREIDISMAQIGATKIADLSPQFLMWSEKHYTPTGAKGADNRARATIE